MLYQLGGVQFSVAPTNIDAVSRERGSDFAVKDIIGAQRPREFMGVGDSEVTLSGKLITHRFGMGALETLAAMAQSGQPQMLARGDGYILGWHYVEKVKEKHSWIGPLGVGRIIEFDLELKQSPGGATASSMVSMLMSLFKWSLFK